MATNESKLIQLPATFAADQDATGRGTDAVIAHRLRQPCLNHNETMLAARPVARGTGFNHNETVLAVRPGGRGINRNHNETPSVGPAHLAVPSSDEPSSGSMIARRKRVSVRELDTGDAHVLDTVFAGLSAQSRYLRFHSPVNALSPDMRRRLLVGGGPGHVALGAFGGWPRRPVGIVRFIAIGSGRAELAVEVVDAWHGRGVGTGLLRAAKQRAAELGYKELVADVLAENGAVRAVLKAVFPGATTRHDGFELTVTLPLVDPVELDTANLMAS